VERDGIQRRVVNPPLDMFADARLESTGAARLVQAPQAECRSPRVANLPRTGLKNRGAVMEKLFHFDTPAEVYKADACVVLLRRTLRTGAAEVSQAARPLPGGPPQIAGSVKGLASPDHEADREFMLRMIRISMRLHQPELVVMVATTSAALRQRTARDIAADSAWPRRSCAPPSRR